jgi:hypothetical protein
MKRQMTRRATRWHRRTRNRSKQRRRRSNRQRSRSRSKMEMKGMEEMMMIELEFINT